MFNDLFDFQVLNYHFIQNKIPQKNQTGLENHLYTEQ